MGRVEETPDAGVTEYLQSVVHISRQNNVPLTFLVHCSPGFVSLPI